MRTRAVFPTATASAGMYESFFLRAFSPERPLGVWIRYTVAKRPGAAPVGSLWSTLFDAGEQRTMQRKCAGDELRLPADGWIAIGDAELADGAARGSCEDIGWELSFAATDEPLAHLSPALLYRAPLPRTKLTSPAPSATFDGVVRLDGEQPITLGGWPGMVGHNWGAEHAERWIWLHCTAFEEEPAAWLDVGIGRLKLAGRMTPWVANGALSVGGRRHRIGGLGARGLRVEEQPGACEVSLPGVGGVRVDVRFESPHGCTAGWRYADPDGGEHDVLNCSIAKVELTVTEPGADTRELSSAHGGAYELGMRERDHGVTIAAYGDG